MTGQRRFLWWTGRFPSILALCLLTACGDFADNAIGINGEPAQNRPLSVEGVWQGTFAPDQMWRHATHKYPEPLKKPCITRGASIRLEARGDRVVGDVVTREGQRFAVRGTARAGAWYTGRNTVFADLLWNDRKIGYIRLVPAAGVDRISGTYSFELNPDTYTCGNVVSLSRISE